MLRALFLKIKMHRVAENFKVILWAIGWLSGPLHGYEWIDTISNSYLMSSSSMAVSIVAGFLTFFSKRCRTVRRFGRCTIQPVSYIWLAVASLVNAIWRWGGDTKQLGVQLILVWVFFVSATHIMGSRLGVAEQYIEKWSQMFNCLQLRCLFSHKSRHYLSLLAWVTPFNHS